FLIVKRQEWDEADLVVFDAFGLGAEAEIVLEDAALFDGPRDEPGVKVQEQDGKQHARNPEPTRDASQAHPGGPHGDDLIVAVKITQGKKQADEQADGNDRRQKAGSVEREV